MIYDVKSAQWERLVFSTAKELQEDFRAEQDAIFDELDDTYQRKYGHPYFRN